MSRPRRKLSTLIGIVGAAAVVSLGGMAPPTPHAAAPSDAPGATRAPSSHALRKARSALHRHDVLKALPAARDALVEAGNDGRPDVDAVDALLAVVRSACPLRVEPDCSRGLERLQAARAAGAVIAPHDDVEVDGLRADQSIARFMAVRDEASESAVAAGARSEALSLLARVEREGDERQRTECALRRARLAVADDDVARAHALDTARLAIDRYGGDAGVFRGRLEILEAIDLVRRGKPPGEAVGLLESARARLVAGLRARHPEIAEVDAALANLYGEAGRPDDAAQARARWLDFVARVPSEQIPFDDFTDAASLAFAAGRPEEGLRYAEALARRLARDTSPDDAELGQHLDLLFESLPEAPADVVARLVRSVAVDPGRVVDERNPAHADLLNRLADAYRTMGRMDDAQAVDVIAERNAGGRLDPEVEAALERSERAPSLDVAHELEELAFDRSWAEHDRRGSIALLRRAAAMRLALGRIDDEALGLTIGVLAGDLHELGHTDDAAKVYEDYIDRLRGTATRDHERTTVVLQAYADFLREIGRPDEAEWQASQAEEEVHLQYRATAAAAVAEKGPASLDARIAVAVVADWLFEHDRGDEAASYLLQNTIVPLLMQGERATFETHLALKGLASDLRKHGATERAALVAEVATAVSARTPVAPDLCARGRVILPELFVVLDCPQDEAVASRASAATNDVLLRAERARRAGGVEGRDALVALVHESQQALAPKDAVALLRDALALQESLQPRNPASEASLLLEIGDALAGSDRAAAIEAYFDAADRLVGEPSFESTLVEDAVGRAAAQARDVRSDGAVQDRFARTLAAVEAIRGTDSDEAARLRTRWANATATSAEDGARVPAGAPTIAQRLDLLRQTPAGLAGEDVGGDRLDLVLDVASTRLADADTRSAIVPALERLLSLQVERLERGHPATTRTALLAASAYRDERRDQDADRAVEIALRGLQRSDDRHSPDWVRLRAVGSTFHRITEARRRADALAAELTAQAPPAGEADRRWREWGRLEHLRTTAYQYPEAADAAIAAALAIRSRFDDSRFPDANVLAASADALLRDCRARDAADAILRPRHVCEREAWRLHRLVQEAVVAGAERQLAEVTDPAARRQARASIRYRTERFVAALIDVESALDDAEAARAKAETLTAAEYVRATPASDVMDARRRQTRTTAPGHDAAAILPVLDIDAVQAMLAPDEAILAYLLADDGLAAWVVRRNAIVQRQLPLDRVELRRLVRGLRSDLDPTAAGGELQPLDVSAAHALWQRILEPLAPELTGVDVLRIVPDGIVSAVPFAALITTPPPSPTWGPNDPWTPDWAVRRFAISFLPSVRAFELGHRTSPSRASHPLLGVGAPLLGSAVEPTNVELPSLLPGGRVDVNALRALPSLPDARRELEAMAAAAGTCARCLLMAERFREPKLYRLPWNRYRSIVFATHGLVPGSANAGYEPALVLTPPTTATTADDGLLSASEIRSLRLDADMVILSACNTGVDASGEEANGLSGLASAFLAAGARSVVVSQWPVISEVASELTVPLIASRRAGSTDRLSTALQRAMLVLADSEQRQHRHPAFWGPFVLVNDLAPPDATEDR